MKKRTSAPVVLSFSSLLPQYRSRPSLRDAALERERKRREAKANPKMKGKRK